jgi:hypothetical protein
MALFSASTNDQYTGSRISIAILGVAVLITIIPACIHTFLPDGGANIIAGLGLDLTSEHGRQIVSLFAWAGTTQLVWGLILLVILLQHRMLVPLALGLLTFERILHCWHFWGPKSGGDHPPEAYATLILIPIFALGAILSLRTPK